MNRWLFIGASAAALIVQPAMSYDASPKRTLSPRGKFEVSFQIDASKPIEGVRSLRYKVSFYKPGHGTEIATTDFYDVKRSPDQTHPAPLADLLRALLWSPEEDFAMLPPERWPADSAYRTGGRQKREGRKAISLNTAYPWQTAPFPLEEAPLVWTDPLRVASHFREGCKAAVAEFDGRTGKISMLSDAPPPAGYEIVSSSGEKLVMKKILGPCATAQDAKFFVPECTVFNLSFKRREIGSCPP